MSTGQEDLFEDQPATDAKGEGNSKTFDEPAKEKQSEVKTDDKAETKEDEKQEEDTGEEKSSESPAEDQKDDKGQKTEKMIPVSQFKAALKDAKDKLEAANKKISQYEATPVPDKEKDPDGYDLHVRMEASKTAMRATHADYQEVVTHYKEMADANPYLNEAVAKHPVPAKYAYDLAKEDIRLKKLGELESSDDWKEFQEFKKAKGAKKEETEKLSDDGNKVGKQLVEGGSKVPNLNRATNVSRATAKSEADDELFANAL